MASQPNPWWQLFIKKTSYATTAASFVRYEIKYLYAIFTWNGNQLFICATATQIFPEGYYLLSMLSYYIKFALLLLSNLIQCRYYRCVVNRKTRYSFCGLEWYEWSNFLIDKTYAKVLFNIKYWHALVLHLQIVGKIQFVLQMYYCNIK